MTKTPAFQTANPPSPEKQPVFDTHHGITRTDDYAWLRADNWQAVMQDPGVLAPDIRAYLEAENAYTDSKLADQKDLVELLFQMGFLVYTVGHVVKDSC